MLPINATERQHAAYVGNLYYVFDVALALAPLMSHDMTVLHGGAKGVDEFGGRWAHTNDFRVKIIRPDWERYGAVAGFVRNSALVGECDAAIVLWDGKSKGTQDTLAKLREEQKPYVLIVRSPASFL